MVHVVYLNDKEKDLDKILSGEKTMVIRGASGRKIPHSRVFEKETLYFMEKGSFTIALTAVVKKVYTYTKIDLDESLEIIESHQDKLLLSDKLMKRWNKKCLCLVEFENIKEINPLEFEHQSNMDDWLIIEKIEDVLEGSSIPYNYSKSRLK